MAICKDCGKDMLVVGTCSYTQIGGKINMFKRIKYGDEKMDWGAGKKKCHDCGVVKGGYHHQGCDVEECPQCHGQLLSCDCNYTRVQM